MCDAIVIETVKERMLSRRQFFTAGAAVAAAVVAAVLAAAALAAAEAVHQKKASRVPSLKDF